MQIGSYPGMVLTANKTMNWKIRTENIIYGKPYRAIMGPTALLEAKPIEEYFTLV